MRSISFPKKRRGFNHSHRLQADVFTAGNGQDTTVICVFKEKVKPMALNYINQRTEKREVIKQFYSVEIAIDGAGHINQFVIYDMSASGLCLLVREDSSLLKRIKVGEKYRMKYYPVNLLDQVKFIDTKICHITRSANSSLAGHYMVGLSLENGEAMTS